MILIVGGYCAPVGVLWWCARMLARSRRLCCPTCVSALDTPRAKALHSSYNRFPPRMYYRWLVSLCLRNSLPRLFPFSALIMYSFTSNLL